MVAPPVDRTSILPLFPEDRLGAITHVEALTLGNSGARVYAVTTPLGEYVLRVQVNRLDPRSFAQQIRVLRRAVDAGVAPAIHHVDEAALAVVFARVPGGPIAAALGDPVKRAAVVMSVVDQLRALHAVDPSDVAESDPVGFTRRMWDECRSRPGFPPWVDEIGAQLDTSAALLAQDPRRVVSHNDVNPVNVLWDGTRAWLVDWEATGLVHPYYDLGTFSLFLRLDDDTAFGLAARHDGAPLDAASRDTFRALRRLAALLSGFAFMRLVEDLTVRPCPTRADAPTLASCFEAIRAGEFDTRKPSVRAALALALLAEGVC